MKIHLVNSAVMPSLEGVYCVHQTTETQFAKLLIGAFKDGNLRSYIGYEQTAQHIEKITGVKIEVRREQCVVDDNDMLAIIRLNHRPAVEDKGKPIDENQFEYAVAHYYADADTMELVEDRHSVSDLIGVELPNQITFRRSRKGKRPRISPKLQEMMDSMKGTKVDVSNMRVLEFKG